MPKVYMPQQHSTDAPCVVVTFSWDEMKNLCENMTKVDGYFVETDPSITAFDVALKTLTRQPD